MTKYDYYHKKQGDLRGARGIYHEAITDYTKPLDALARIFSQRPYVAIIQPGDANNNDLYVSFPDSGSLSENTIGRLQADIANVLANRNDATAKKKLFVYACSTDNALFTDILVHEQDRVNHKYNTREINPAKKNSYLDYIDDLRNGKYNAFFSDNISDLRAYFIDDLVTRRFDEFLSGQDLELLRNLNLQNKNLIKVPNQEDYHGVHVEAKGVHYVHRQTDLNVFYLGLAQSNGDRDVGCCGACCVEFRLLEQGKNNQGRPITVYRTADYPASQPANGYEISPSIRGDEKESVKSVFNKGPIVHYIDQDVKWQEEVGNLTQERDNLQHQATQNSQQIDNLSTELETKKQEAEGFKEQSNKVEQEVGELKKQLGEQREQFEQQKTKLEAEHKLKLEEQQFKHKQQLELQEKLEKLKEEYKAKSKKQVQQLKEQLALELQEAQEKLKKEHEEASQEQVQLEEQRASELQEKLKDGNNHLKQADKWMLSQDEDEQSYSLHDSLVAINGNLTLLDKLKIKSVITADIDLKAIYVKEDMPQGKAGRVEFLAEYHHESDHGRNIQLLIESIESGSISEDTVIAIERKSYGKSLGMPDVILLASIIEHNGQNPNGQLQIPEEIINGSLIYHDALLYKTASEHGVKIVGLEGRNLQADKIFPGEYDQTREEYMADRIHQVARKGYNVIIHVGAAHVDSLRKFLTSFAEIDTSESSRWDRVLSEVAGSDFVGDAAESFDDMIFASCAHDYPSQEIDLIGNYTF